jgi:hypothetical protein
MRRVILQRSALAVALVAAMGLAARALVGPAPPPRLVHETVELSPEQAAAARAMAGPPAVPDLALGMPERIAVVVAGRQVTIRGSAKVIDKTPGNVYVWMLRVHGAGRPTPDNLLQEYHYHDVPFLLAEGQVEGRAEFERTITLEPGRYRIRLMCYGSVPAFPRDRIARGEDFSLRVLMGPVFDDAVVVVE